jgi:tRNA 2-selenouridine synthase
MSKSLDAADFLSLSQGHLVIDVRSPKEFNKGHIPHAVSLPLFSDEERARVGTLYTQTGRYQAIEAGLEIVGPKMADFVRFVRPLVRDNKIFVHCWRGGMRSGSMAWLFDTMGYEVYTLRSGYKAYRHMVLEGLARPAHYIIIGGRTGSGKTDILHHLRDRGEQILDFEGLAHHKGSSFGALGESPQPSTEQFENTLYLKQSKLDLSRTIWLEDESKNIGRCSLTNELWAHMCQSPLIVLDIPLEVRVRRLVQDYGAMPPQGLEGAIRRIERRLGNEAMKDALRHLAELNLSEVARITLRYYDKAYDHSLAVKQTKDITFMSFDADDISLIAEKLIEHRKHD